MRARGVQIPGNRARRPPEAAATMPDAPVAMRRLGVYISVVSNGRALIASLSLAVACSTADRGADPPVQSAPAAVPASGGTTEPGADPARAEAIVEPCPRTVPVWRDGAPDGEVCADRAADDGLTLVDLGDGFAPRIFSEEPSTGVHPYRATYLALADEQLDALPRNQPAERYLELYGITPTFRVLHQRLAEAERHRCHDELSDAALAELSGTLRAWTADVAGHQQRLTEHRALLRRLETIAEARGVSLDSLRDEPALGATFARFDRVRVPLEAVRATQAHLRCDGLLSARVPDGLFEWHTASALRVYQQRHTVVSGGFLDAQTRAVLALDSREADFHAVLRALRERVVDATGIIEDGSAIHEHGTISGREVDPPEMRAEAGQPPVPGGSPDYVSPATEAAARALGWTDADSFVRFYEANGRELGIVAVPLPAPPPWHSPHMELRAEIDRGDVWYQYPYTDSGGVRGHRVERRPVLTLYATHDGRDVALVRWPTTIGGWKPEIGPEGSVRLAYKNSPAGPRVWRDLIASPAWLPPAGTPDQDLMKRRGDRWVPNHTLLGPGYRSAYGLAMLIHHEPRTARDPEAPRVFHDEGIRTHGSVSYRSILVGTSHGCHRLYNHLAVRLTGYVLAHRTHVRRGRLPALWEREVSHEGSTGRLDVTTRGYHFELTPPVPVEVLEGRVHGRRRRPSTDFHDLREDLVERVQADAAEDG